MTDIYKHLNDFLSKWVEGHYYINDYTGLSVCVYEKGQKIFSANHGYADVERNIKWTDKHLFRVASHSKTFTAVSILQLVEQNKLKLNDKVSKYLPYFSDNKITIKDLLSHSAGISRDMYNQDFWTFGNPFPDQKKLETFFSKDINILKPRQKFKYSNCGYALLGQIIEKVAKKSFSDYISENIIKPIGLKNTFADYDNKTKNLVKGYSYKFEKGKKYPFEHTNTNSFAAATGLCSTAQDLCKFYSNLSYKNTSLISDKLKKKAFKKLYKIDKDTRSYGLGFICRDAKDVFGHTGGFMGFASGSDFNPNKDIVVSVMINEMKGGPAQVSKAIYDIITFFLDNKEQIISSPFIEYNGVYANIWGREYWLGLKKDVALLSVDSYNDFNDLGQLSFVAEDVFKVASCSGFSDFGEQQVIIRDKSKTITHCLGASKSKKI